VVLRVLVRRSIIDAVFSPPSFISLRCWSAGRRWCGGEAGLLEKLLDGGDGGARWRRRRRWGGGTGEGVWCGRFIDASFVSCLSFGGQASHRSPFGACCQHFIFHSAIFPIIGDRLAQRAGCAGAALLPASGMHGSICFVFVVRCFW